MIVMGLSYDKIKKQTDLFNYTGLYASEFNRLVAEFRLDWDQYSKHYTMRGQVRKRNGYPRRNTVLRGSYNKLLFVLIYLKTSPTQEELASSFSMLQPQAYCWIQLLKSILKITLTRLIEVNGSDNQQLITFLNQCSLVPEKNFEYRA